MYDEARGICFCTLRETVHKDLRFKSCGGVTLRQQVNSWEAVRSSVTSITIYLSTYGNIKVDVTLSHHRFENWKCCYVHQFAAFLLICWIHGLFVVSLGYLRVHDVYIKLVAISTVIKIIYSKPTSLRQFLTLRCRPQLHLSFELFLLREWGAEEDIWPTRDDVTGDWTRLHNEESVSCTPYQMLFG